MHEINQLRKNKISLGDYDFKQDIENRLLMAQFSSVDLEVLEEILYSSIKVPIRKLAKIVDLEDEEVLPILENLSKTGLFTIKDDSILIDKDVRKYFEAQMMKFEPDFKPGMEFLQGLLRKVPIPVLPVWYSIPRTSNNIFDSLVEKYLLSPQIFYRYLGELHFPDPVLTGIMNDLYASSEFKLYGEDVIKKYGITREIFEESLLHLEFNFVCCLGYEKVENQWKEIIIPFHEWHEYLAFLKSTEATSISSTEEIKRKRPQDFSFIQDITVLLTLAKKQPIPMSVDKSNHATPSLQTLEMIADKMENCSADSPVFLKYLQHLITKVRMLKLADVIDGRLFALEGANDWLDMRLENRALFLYRHPLNKLLSEKLPAHLCTERNLKEAEKSICRVLNSGWVYFDDYIRGVIVPIGEDSIVMLKRQGKTWKYSLPTYSEDELALIKATVLEWLFEIGVTAAGTHAAKECFCVTPFGQSLFGR